MDGDGVEAAKNAPVRRKCPKCGNWMRVMIRGRTVYDVSADSSVSPDDIRKKSKVSGRSSKKKKVPDRSDLPISSPTDTKSPSPFDKEDDLFEIIEDPDIVSHCPNCDSSGVWLGKIRKGVIFTIVKCADCKNVWATDESWPDKPVSHQSWFRLEHEDDLERKEQDGCFIATAAYGSPEEKEIDRLREFRDETLLQTRFGEWFVSKYYRYSPPIAEWISRSERRKRATRTVVIRPSLWAIGLFE
jgi:DNA-directed RNA polymerase subunit M/transcription elongation factor TFIIS